MQSTRKWDDQKDYCLSPKHWEGVLIYGDHLYGKWGGDMQKWEHDKYPSKCVTAQTYELYAKILKERHKE